MLTLASKYQVLWALYGIITAGQYITSPLFFEHLLHKIKMSKYI